MRDEFVPRLGPGVHVDLANYSTLPPEHINEDEAKHRRHDLDKELESLQELLYGAQQNALLLIFQGMDTSGKDGAIQHVISAVNAEGCDIHSFKVPTPVELGHDFLWRIHMVTPERGMIGIFNRSQYEEVLVVRVHNLAPAETLPLRYNSINNFEHLLADNKTIIVKFFLHISKEEQARRLLDREEEVRKAWKLSPGDWTERQYWDQYIKAYEDALANCNTPYAPWYIVPADKKWYRDLVIADVLVRALEPYKQSWQNHLAEMQATSLKLLSQNAERNKLRAERDAAKQKED